jgi:hypothetical protein
MTPVSRQWVEPDKNSTKKRGHNSTSQQWKKIPNSITASSDTTVSYDITKTKHRFKTANYKDKSKPTDNVWIGINHEHLPTYWCPLSESWESRPESLHHDCVDFIQKRETRYKIGYTETLRSATLSQNIGATITMIETDNDHNRKRHATSDRTLRTVPTKTPSQ